MRATGAGSAARVGRRTGGFPTAGDPKNPAGRKETMTATSPATDARPVYIDIGKALGTDYFLLKDELTTAEQRYLERTRGFVQEEVLPVINDYWQRAEVPVDLCRRLGELGLIGDGLEGYGCPPMSATAAGFFNPELNPRGRPAGTLP